MSLSGCLSRWAAVGGESIVEYDLTVEERTALQASAEAVRELCLVVDRLLTA